jgi:hypothetical protein
VGRWMISCKEHSSLVSENLDRPLTLWARMSIKMHEWLCPACQHIRVQLEVIRAACRSAGPEMTPEERDACRLSEKASARIKTAVEQALSKEEAKP